MMAVLEMAVADAYNTPLRPHGDAGVNRLDGWALQKNGNAQGCARYPTLDRLEIGDC